MIINLFYLAEPRFGGWPTFTQHLHKSLQMIGHDVRLFRIGNRFEQQQRPFGGGVYYQNINIEAALSLVKKDTGNLITALGGKHEASGAALISAGACIVIHDPTELRPSVIQILKNGNARIVVIRQANIKLIEAQKMGCTLIRHPFVPMNLNLTRKWNAVAFSRLDFDKGTHIIAAANSTLPPEKCIHIFGSENRLYTFHKLSKDFPKWRMFYHGQFEASRTNPSGTALQIASQSKYVVDMSSIKSDGGGTQYTFLEAWNAGAVLIINSKWANGFTSDDLKPMENCHAAESAQHLHDLLFQGSSNEGDIISAGFKSLQKHDPKQIALQYEALFGVQ